MTAIVTIVANRRLWGQVRRRGRAAPIQADPGARLQIEASVEGRNVRVGTAGYLATAGVDAAAHQGSAVRLSREGKTPVFVAVDGRVAALLGVSDPLRVTSEDVLRDLRSLGLEIGIVSGDTVETSEALARRLHVKLVFAAQSPSGKADQVRRLQASGRRVAFVGDGINDAPALAQADVGIALGSGTDVAIEAGDVVLMRGEVRSVPLAVTLARRAMRTIRQNFFWAYAYNVALVPLAAGVLYPLLGTLLSPTLAAAAMSSSSLFVLANSLRLSRFARGPGAARMLDKPEMVATLMPSGDMR